ncbi:MAG: YfhO family protein [Bacteroidales bacterium]|nr:YfhO family protein [Bacteroidales bacterium]
MKREKKTPQVVKKQLKKDKPQRKKQILQKTFFEKYPAPYSIWILIGLVFIIGFIALGKYITGEYLFFFKDIGSDSLNQTYPALANKIELMKEGSGKWSFYKGMGEVSYSTFDTHPLSWFRTIIDYIGIRIWSEDYYIAGMFLKNFIFHFLLSGIVAYYYFRTISIKHMTSIIGALIIAFSGFMVVGSSWGFSGQIFNAVFLLFSFEQLFVKKRWYFFPFAIMFICVNPFNLYLYSLFLFIYVIFRFTSSDAGKFSGFLKLTGKMIVLGIAGLLMNISKILPVFLKLFFSPRVAGNVSYSQALSQGQEIVEHNNLTATTLLRFFSNDILGTGSNFQAWQNYFEAPLFYIGLLTLLIFPQVFIHLNKRKKIIFGSFFGFWVLTLIFPYLRHAFLAFTGDYFRFGFDFFIPFTLLFFAVYALNELDKSFKINYVLLGGTLAALLIVLFFPYNSISPEAVDNSLRMKIVFILLLYSGLLILMSKPKYKSFAQIGILVLLVVELSYFSYKSYSGRLPVTRNEFNKDKGGYNDGTIDAVEYIKNADKKSFYRTEKDYQSGSAEHSSLNDALAQSYFGTTRYSSFNQINYVRFLEETGLIQKGDETATRWITGFRGYPLLQTFGNVKYHLSKSENPEFLNFGFDSFARINGIKILKNRYYLPFGYTYDKYIAFDDFKKLMYYQITGQSLTNIFTDLSRFVDTQTINQLISELQNLLNKQYSDIDTFTEAITTQIGEDESEKYLMTITKYSILNFKNQVALLNAFVYEEEDLSENKIQDLNRIELSDTNILIPATKFNFEIYKRITGDLKNDTLQITEFKQSEIKGKINMSGTKMLFFTIPYDKGWKVKVNGKEENLLRVNIGFTGIVLPKGVHEIELYYVPQYSKVTNTVSIISIILFWLYLGCYVYRKRKKKKITL